MPLLYRLLGRRLGYAALAVAVATLALVLSIPEGFSGTVNWVPQLGIALTVQADGWGRLLALLITGIGTLVMLYSILYLGAEEDLGKFYLYILLFMGAMLGVVLSGNLLVLYVFWELTSVASFLLIGFWYTEESGVYGAVKALLITVSGGLAMLAGITILGSIAGTYELTALVDRRSEVLAHPLSGVALVLILLGAFTKSAQVPFHIWLPDAMAAPTPVSAYLHSATMVKAGLFLVARLWPLFSPHPYWTGLVSTVGLATMVLGAYLALQKTDLKAILAMSTVSQLGLILSLFGYGTAEGVAAGILHLFNHSTFKGLLFMVVGIIDHMTGTREVTRLSGLARAMPVTAALAAVGAGAMAGVPLLSGFVSKELFLEASLHGPLGALAAAVGTGASILTTTYCLVLAHKIFYGPETHDTPKHPHEAPWPMLLPPAVLAAVVVAVGVYPGLVEHGLVAPAVAAVLGEEPHLHLALWHGFTPALGMSAVALVGGLVAYRRLDALAALLGRIAGSIRLHANAVYDYLWWREKAVERWARAITSYQMTGFLRDYLVFILGAAVLGILTTAWMKGLRIGELNLAPVEPHEWVLMGVIAAGALTTLLARNRLVAIAALGITGLPVSLYFAWMRAPDLALTQLVVEVITTVLFLLVFAHLPQLKVDPPTPRYRDVNVLVAVAVGAVAALYTLLAAGLRRFPPEIARYYLENSYEAAGGKNVVNVILVDFRGWDTLFEITVLSMAGLAVYSLTRLGRSREAEEARGGESW
nr:MAG: Na+/H+ antiporter subunit A [Bacillota bacterium]